MIFKLQRESVREVLVETHVAGPCEAVSDSLSLEWNMRNSILNEFLADDDIAGLGTSL